MPNCTLTQKDNTGADLTDCSFTGQDLTGYIFKSCTLLGTDFSGCKFDAVTDFTRAIFGKSSANKVTSFAGCDLSLAKFSAPANFGARGTRPRPTDLTGATIPWNLLGRNFQFVDITGATFKDLPVDLSKLELTSVKWNKFDFTGKKLTNTHFNNCDLTDCIMTGVNLDYVSFIQSTNLTRVKMNKCSLYHTIFEGSTMINTDLSYATKLSDCKFRNTELKGTLFDGNDMTDSAFGVPNLMSTDPAYITSFRFAKLNASFLVTNLAKNWQCIDFRNVIIKDFSSITGQLYNLVSKNSLFNNTLSFENAKLNGADFSGATFNGVTFKGALMNNSYFVNAKTCKGNEMGPPGAIIGIVQDDPRFVAPNDYTNFKKYLTDKDTANIIKVFAFYGYQIGGVTCTPVTDPVSQHTAWEIIDKSVSPERKYIVVDTPVSGTSKFQLLTYDLSPCNFNYAHMVGSYLENSDFSNSLMNQVQLFGATITYATLSNVDLTGAQLGTSAAVFSTVKSDTSVSPPYDYASFLTDLQTPKLADIINVFNHYGYVIGNITINSTTPPPGGKSAWSIQDNLVTPARNFTVVLMVPTDESKSELNTFFNDARAAKLDNTYMPGVILTRANLTGCSAHNCHLYNNEQIGTRAYLTGTTLVDVQFNNANLYKVDFTSAILTGANFAGANLMEAVFNGVVFDSGTIERHVTFNKANLQGTDFTGSRITGGNFLDAAICMPVSTSTPGATFGVWLKNIQPANPLFNAYVAELDKGSKQVRLEQAPMTLVSKFLQPGAIKPQLVGILTAKEIVVNTNSMVAVSETQDTWKITDGTNVYTLIPGFDKNSIVAFEIYKDVVDNPPALVTNIDYYTPLKIGKVTQALIDLLKSKPGDQQINLGANANVSKFKRAVAWTVTDLTTNTGYALWWGVYLVDLSPTESEVQNAIFVRSSLPELTTLFNIFGINLRLQSKITKTTDVTGGFTTWLLNMGKNDTYYLNTGYIQFKIIGNSATTPTQFNIYGYTMRMLGMGDNGREVIRDFDCSVTKLTASNIDESTLMPNNATKTQNVNKSLPFEKWMWADNKAPNPPVCVPTGMSYCPRPTAQVKSTKKSSPKTGRKKIDTIKKSIT
ncbi:MAG TPA: pentapeptide repeat-containing protein [Saprospiraceae bacterium]|nr:pentapeptide repeat-containing protein [Saprospiraceae bacterium]